MRPWPNVARRDLEHLARRPRARSRREPSREPESTTRTSTSRSCGAHRGEQLREVARAVLDGDDDGERRAHPSSWRLARLDAPHRARAARIAARNSAAPRRRHQRVEVQVPAVEPVGALLRRGDAPRSRARLLGALALELGDAGAQRLELGSLVVRQLASQVLRHPRGLARRTPRARARTAATTIPSGISRRAAPPIASAALGAVGSITAWRICVRTDGDRVGRYELPVVLGHRSWRRTGSATRRTASAPTTSQIGWMSRKRTKSTLEEQPEAGREHRQAGDQRDQLEPAGQSG